MSRSSGKREKKLRGSRDPPIFALVRPPVYDTTPTEKEHRMTQPVGTLIQPKFWFQDYDNIVLLAKYMAENDSEAGEIADAIEKPWKYTEVFGEALSEAGSE
jgi:hypothetical protein